MIQMWSRASVAMPLTGPTAQFFGRGFGHAASTAKAGASLAGCASATGIACLAEPGECDQREATCERAAKKRCFVHLGNPAMSVRTL